MGRHQSLQNFINVSYHSLCICISFHRIWLQCSGQDMLNQLFCIYRQIQFLNITPCKIILIIFTSKSFQNIITVFRACQKIQKQISCAVQICFFTKAKVSVFSSKNMGNFRCTIPLRRKDWLLTYRCTSAIFEQFACRTKINEKAVQTLFSPVSGHKNISVLNIQMGIFSLMHFP